MDADHVLMGAGLILAFGVAWIAFLAYVRFRRIRLVACPADGRPAAVEVDARHAALTALPQPDLRIASCTNWPERARCGQLCVDQVEAGLGRTPADALLADWYRSRWCALCSSPFERLRWVDRPPALMDAGGRIRHWYEVPAEGLAAALERGEYRPVCWWCHLTQTMWLSETGERSA